MAVFGGLIGAVSLAWEGDLAAGAGGVIGLFLTLVPSPGWVPGSWQGPLAGALGAMGAVLMGHGSAAAAPVLVVLAGGLTAVLTHIWGRGWQEWTTSRPSPTAVETVSPELLLAAAVLGAGLLMGLPAGVEVGVHVLPVRPIGAAALVTLAAVRGGAAYGAAAGVLVGMAHLLSQAPDPATMDVQARLTLAYAGGGLLGGSCRQAGGWAAGLGFLLSFFFVRLAAGDPIDTGYAQVLGAVLGLIATAVRKPGTASHGQPPEEEGRVERERATAATPVSESIAALARVMRSMRRGFADPLWDEEGREKEAADDPLAPRIGEVVDRVCQGCALFRHCWHIQYQRTHQTFAFLWGELERVGSLAAHQPPPALARLCKYPAEFATAMNGVFDRYQLRQQSERRWKENRDRVAEHLQGVAALLEQLAAAAVDLSGSDPGLQAGEPALLVQAQGAKLPKRGNLVSGDSILYTALGRRHFLMALSDGMGGGRRAAAESRLALESLAELLQAGYELGNAVQAVNSAMMLRQVGDGYATLDAVLVDLCTGRAQFAKVGAPPSLIRRERSLQLVRAEVPPAGIVQPLPLDLQERTLFPGDWVLLVSDGLWELAAEGVHRPGEWLGGCLQGDLPSQPETLAEAVLARALELAEAPADDMTVLAARICRVDPGAGADGLRQRVEWSHSPMPARRVRASPGEELRR